MDEENRLLGSLLYHSALDHLRESINDYLNISSTREFGIHQGQQLIGIIEEFREIDLDCGRDITEADLDRVRMRMRNTTHSQARRKSFKTEGTQ